MLFTSRKRKKGFTKKQLISTLEKAIHHKDIAIKPLKDT